MLLAERMGKTRIIAETGAGQHGVATATVAALYGRECVVYMGEEDTRRQAPNVLRMKLLGTEVVPVTTGSGDRKSTRLNSSHANISYAVFCLKKKSSLPLPPILSAHPTLAATLSSVSSFTASSLPRSFFFISFRIVVLLSLLLY